MVQHMPMSIHSKILKVRLEDKYPLQLQLQHQQVEVIQLQLQLLLDTKINCTITVELRQDSEEPSFIFQIRPLAITLRTFPLDGHYRYLDLDLSCSIRFLMPQ